jgi:hypothetical protein
MKKLSNSCGISFFVTILLAVLSIGGGFIYSFFTEKNLTFPFEILKFVSEAGEDGARYTSIKFTNSLFIILAGMFIGLTILIFVLNVVFDKKKDDLKS